MPDNSFKGSGRFSRLQYDVPIFPLTYKHVLVIYSHIKSKFLSFILKAVKIITEHCHRFFLLICHYMEPRETGNVSKLPPLSLLRNRKKNEVHEGAMNRY